MKNLLLFQLKRLKNKNVLILLPCLLILIGFFGLFFGVVFYGKQAPPAMWLVSVFNAYTQFSFLFLIYIFVSTFTDDFHNGVYSFLKQLGFSYKQCLICKVISVYVICFIGTNIFMILTNLIGGNKDINFLLIILLSVNLSLVFIILLTVILSLVLKKTMTATLVGYGLFLIMNIINYIGFGLTNPADGNSISSVALRHLADNSMIEHYSLKRTTINFDKYGSLLAVMSPLIWDLILILIVLILVKREDKKNEI